jgi:hypothetical protein
MEGGENMSQEVTMKDNYEFNTPPRKNPYAERIRKHGYSVAIHYESPEDAETDSALDTIRSLLKREGLNSIHLYINNNNNGEENSVCAETADQYKIV